MNMSYSAFENTDLENQLRLHGIRELGICGIATEYCVKAAAMDALRLGFKVFVLRNLIRPIEKNHGDFLQAERDIEDAGIPLVSSAQWLKIP